MEICVIGMGYIGLPMAAMFASAGMDVTGVDIIADWCDDINRCEFSIMEKNLERLVKRVVQDGALYCRTEASVSDVFIIAVPTPVNEDKTPNLSHVLSAGENLSEVLKKGDLVIVESTIPPGFTAGILAPHIECICGLKAGEDYDLAYCPERIMPGNTVEEIVNTVRIIGGITPQSAQRAKELYSTFVKAEIVIADLVTTEVSKLAENTFRDINIAYANSIAMLCDRLGCNVWDVIQLANRHPRVDMLCPGPGVGGHCIAVDPWFLVSAGEGQASIIEAARRVNDNMPVYVAEQIRQLVPRGGKALILGCTYKADVDDTRESPILKIRDLLEGEMAVSLVDPFVPEYNLDVYRSAEDADIVVLGVAHKAFDSLDFARLAHRVRCKAFFDTRNSPLASRAAQNGFAVSVLGAGGGQELASLWEEQTCANVKK